jgi:hypothetical protein
MADMGVTETAATAAELIAAIVQSQLIAKSKMIGCVRDESARAVKGAASIDFPRTGDLTPDAKAENTGSTAQVLTFAADTLSLDQHFHTLVKLEDKASIQSSVNVELEIQERAGRGMAKKVDTYIYEALRDGASASNPDHILDHYSASGTITRTKILQARTLLNLQNVPDEDRFMLIGPNQEAELLDIDQFVSAEKYGSRDALLNGEIGRLFGFTVVMSTVCEDNKTLYWHRDACVFANQLAPKWETFRDVVLLADVYSLSQLWGAKVLDSGKRHVSANASGS